MNLSDVIKYYTNKEVRKEIARVSKNREVVGRFLTGEFMSRPSTISYEQEVLDLVRKGVSSFHMSEERWSNPLQLRSDMSRKELDELRIGWDLILDIDSKHIDFGKLCAFYVEELLEFHGVTHYSIKFSGGKGFHIAIPYESFPEKVGGKNVKDLFPEASRIIATYIQEQIKPLLTEAILDKYSLKDIETMSGVKFESEDKFDVTKIVSLDPVAISSRHMIRMPYSLNEKTWLVSIPIKKGSALKFKLEEADPKKVVVKYRFLDTYKEGEAENLFIEAFDFKPKTAETSNVSQSKPGFKFIFPKEKVTDKNIFPPCIRNILKGMEDGRKRSLFILINYFKLLGWDWDTITNEILEWNKRNKEPLSMRYIKSQLSYYKRRKDYMIPNCSSENFYKDLNICTPDNTCKRIKNPINYSYKKVRYRR